MLEVKVVQISSRGNLWMWFS